MKKISNEPIGVTFTHLGEVGQYAGLTKREYFAALAMQGTISASNNCSPDLMDTKRAQSHAKAAVMLADALIAELDKGE